MMFVTGGSGFVGRHLIASFKARGPHVRALARSARAALAVRRAGAAVVHGSLADIAALRDGMHGCSVVVHAAADVRPWGRFADFYATNVVGTHNVLQAARAAQVRCVVYISTEAVLLDGSPLVNVDEMRPIPRYPLGAYARTKAAAETVVRQASSREFRTIVIRPRFVWGADDTSLMPQLIRAARAGRFAWIDGGDFPTSTCHVENLCEGVWCAVQQGRTGTCYFVTDGAPVHMRSFGEALMRTQGIELPRRSVPRPLASGAGTLMEALWRTLARPEMPPVTRAMVAAMGCEVTLDDARARHELGYTGRVTIDEGLRSVQRMEESSI